MPNDTESALLPQSGAHARATNFAPAEATRVRRQDRARGDAQFIASVIDEAPFCHLATLVRGAPLCLPMAHGRVGETIYLHGALRSQILSEARAQRSSLTFTLLDGFVFGRRAFNHSMNYRSVVAFGTVREIQDNQEKMRAMEALVDHSAPGRYRECELPSEGELQATQVIAFDVSEASAKCRQGPPYGDVAGEAGEIWAGVLPVRLSAESTQRPPGLSPAARLPSSVTRLIARLGGEPVVESTWQGVLLSSDPARVDVRWVRRFLAEESYWARGVSLAAVTRSLSGSLVFGAYRAEMPVAFARVVSDGARVGYLADVFVDQAERGRGLGKRLVEFVLEHPAVQQIERLILGTRDAEGLYARFGFAPAQHAFMTRRQQDAGGPAR